MSADIWTEVVSGTRDQAEAVYELFHENSKITRLTRGMSSLEIARRMSGMWDSFPYDVYPATDLPEPAIPTGSLDQVVRSRHTAGGLRPVSIELARLATLLEYGYGVTRDNVDGPFPRPFRTVPSAGALFPLELYVLPRAVDELSVGLYHYNPVRRQLRLIRAEDLTDEISTSLAQPDIAYDASFIVLVTAAFERVTFKYGDRGYRFTLLEAGHVAQNICLGAAAFGLGAMTLGGYYDREIDEVLGLDGVSRSTVYLVAVGEDSSDPLAYQVT